MRALCGKCEEPIEGGAFAPYYLDDGVPTSACKKHAEYVFKPKEGEGLEVIKERI